MRKARGTMTTGCVLVALVAALHSAGEELEWAGPSGQSFIVQGSEAEASRTVCEGSEALELRFRRTEWPNVSLSPREGVWDCSGAAAVAVDFWNPQDVSVTALVRVENEGATYYEGNASQPVLLLPRQWTRVTVPLETPSPVLWGMRGIPGRGPLPFGEGLDAAKVKTVRVVVQRPDRPYTLCMKGLALVSREELEEAEPKLPLIDPLGQYRHADWPGKVRGEADLRERGAREEEALQAASTPEGWDRYGGWAQGPQLEATGWFRTEKVDGRWWLVTPDGHVFFSTGMDCVATFDTTWVDGRDGLFEWLPERTDDNPFRGFYHYREGAHSMAEPIGGKGWTFGFYGANLLRKYGDDWRARWRDTTYRRLRSWGFNTLGNWCEWDVLENSPMPFVVSLGSGKARTFAVSTGYWGNMKDVYDPEFAAHTDEVVAGSVARFAGNPLCIGYFVDNELSWGDPRAHVLECPPDQPARRAFIEQLQAKYDSLEALNRAWGTDAQDWDSLRNPPAPTPASAEDFDAFTYAFARRYFETINSALKKHAPHQLYLGCRFAGMPERPIVRACADVADVVSVNMYVPVLNEADWTGENDCGKPMIIGEFHFGALDRGMFHTGLQGVADQKARGAAYRRYLESVADLPNFVGCHWFQYIDEPVTGRWMDGENYNIGFVTVTDTPYTELVEAAREVHGEVYRRRLGTGR